MIPDCRRSLTTATGSGTTVKSMKLPEENVKHAILDANDKCNTAEAILRRQALSAAIKLLSEKPMKGFEFGWHLGCHRGFPYCVFPPSSYGKWAGKAKLRGSD
jgi:hypothetical protein